MIIEVDEEMLTKESLEALGIGMPHNGTMLSEDIATGQSALATSESRSLAVCW